MKDIVVAIDGPSAAGKSTVAELVASKLDYRYIDTGAMYRAIALFIQQNNVDFQDESAIKNILPKIKVELTEDRNVLLNNEVVTLAIRTPEISKLVSIISVYKSVREFLLNRQKEYAKEKKVVMEGRDIGSYVIPDADLKIFQTATVESRSLRRYNELLSKGIQSSLDELQKDIRERDYRDSHREFAPLKKVADSVELDTSNLSAEEAAEIIVALARKKINND